MGLLYPSTQQATPTLTQFVGAAMPIEDRLVVQYEEDLHNPNTWGEVLYGVMWGLRIFKGMTVLVATDQDDTKNGLYWLKTMPLSEDYYKIGEWGTDQCMSIDGWVQVGKGNDIQFDNDTIQQNPTAPINDPNDPDYDPNATDQDNTDDEVWYANHVKRVYGGTWSAGE